MSECQIVEVCSKSFEAFLPIAPFLRPAEAKSVKLMRIIVNTLVHMYRPYRNS